MLVSQSVSGVVCAAAVFKTEVCLMNYDESVG